MCMRRRIQEHFRGGGFKFFGIGPIFPDLSKHFMPWKYIVLYIIKILKSRWDGLMHPRTSPSPNRVCLHDMCVGEGCLLEWKRHIYIYIQGSYLEIMPLEYRFQPNNIPEVQIILIYSFICSNKSFICSNDLLIRPNESFICSNESFVQTSLLFVRTFTNRPNEPFTIRTIY